MINVSRIVRHPTVWMLVLISLAVSVAVSTTYTTLFSYDDPISQLWSNNFTRVVHGSKQMWFVMFYAAWCGHCQSVAPIYSNFSRHIAGWSPVVGLASVECAEKINEDICRKYGVRGYPTFKLFQSNTDPSNLGVPIPKNKNSGHEDDMRRVVLRYLDELVRKGETDPSWPQLKPVRSASDLWTGQNRQVFVVAENAAMSDDNVGLAVILDLLPSRPSLVVGRTTVGGIPGAVEPGLYSATRSGVLSIISRERNEGLLVEAINAADHSEHKAAPSAGSYVATLRPTTFTYSVRRSQGLHMMDIESSLYRSLWLEVPLQPSISGRRLAALKSYINLLVQYHPAEEHVMRFLRKLADWLESASEPISSMQWRNKLSSLQSDDAFISNQESYTGCLGSKPHYRGYPCGLWMTFHALTVGAYQQRRTDVTFRPADILASIGGYIQHFFGCRYCAEHFATLLKPMTSEVSLPGDVVLWLWRAHNNVNNRLHGEITEDPQAPKIQFPSRESCPKCIRSSYAVDPFHVNETSWSEADVLDYLVTHYARSRVIDDHDESLSSGSSSIKLANRHKRNSSSSSRNQSNSTNCLQVQTDWTKCSRSCDVGVSTRMTNSNSDCLLRKEVRLCLVRPCSTKFADWSQSPWHISRCTKVAHTYKLPRAQTLSYANCTTVDPQIWNVCGLCPSARNRPPVCCRPERSTTKWMNVMCTAHTEESGGGRMVGRHPGKLMVEVVEYCKCDENC